VPDIAASPTPSLQPAPLLRRIAAFCYDLLVLVALMATFTLIAVLVRGGREIEPGSGWFEACLGAITTLFFCGFWVHGGQTLGMRAWRIRVVTADGGELHWPRAAARFGAAILALLPAGLGLWWSVLDSDRRGWHDRWTATRVVRMT
jgi:uncharacterized RDD family membrane protein YckC